MANRILTTKEFVDRIADSIRRSALELGVTEDQFYEALRVEWNKAIEEDDDE